VILAQVRHTVNAKPAVGRLAPVAVSEISQSEANKVRSIVALSGKLRNSSQTRYAADAEMW
jgi:hypothetical protein